MKRAGFTLLEMMIALTILTTVLGVLYMLSLSTAQAVKVEEAKMASQDEARRALQFLIRELRQAARQSVNQVFCPARASAIA